LIPEDADDRDTADGRPATRAFARARLARMVGTDADAFTEEQADELVRLALVSQCLVVVEAMECVIEDRPLERIVLSGSGEFLGRKAAAWEWRTVPLTSLTERLGPELSQAACAYAVACEALAAGLA